MKKSKLILIGVGILIIFLSCSISFADIEVVNVDILPDSVWLHENPVIEIFARCEVDGVFISDADVKASIYPPGFSSPTMSPTLHYDPESERYRYSFKSPFYKTGKYNVEVTCSRDQDSSTASGEFIAHKLELNIIRDGVSSVDAYMGGELKLYVEFLMDGELVPPSQDTFDVYIDKENVEQDSVPIIVDNYQEITVEIPLRPRYIDEEGTYDLEVIGEYGDGERITISAEKKEFINVHPPLKIDLQEDVIQCPFGSTCERDLSVAVVFAAGSIDDLTLENVEAVIVDTKAKGKKMYIDSMVCDDASDTCKISLDIPSNLEPGSYDLFLTLAYPQISDYKYKSQDSIPLEVVLQLRGDVRDASGNIVDTRITLENQDTGQIIIRRTGVSGDYALDLLPGTYDITLEFTADKVISRFEDVSITDSDIVTISENLIRYDKDHLNSGIPGGLRIVKVMVIEFALPFSNTLIYLPYDSSKVDGDENDLKVYKCGRWNFKKSSCSGEWIGLWSKVHTIKDIIEFDAKSSGAFVIGEKKSLRLTDVVVKNEIVYMSDTVHIIGRVIDNEGNPVERAVVECSFPRFNISDTFSSGTDGIFTADINAPYVEGPVTLVIGVKGGPFISYNETLTLNLIRSKKLDITGIPDTVDIGLDEPRVITFKLFNSGQTDLTDKIYLSVAGMSSDWYEILPASIDGLSANQQKSINLKIKLTNELCGGRCKQFTLINVEAKSNQVSKDVSFTLNILQPPEEEAGKDTSEEQAQETETPESGIPGITGFVISLPSLDSPYILSSIIIIMVLLIINKKKKVKKKKGFGKMGIRSPVVASLHRIKGGI
ncbi:MAG: hypothetical protein U9Q22_07250 [Candidatus Altiarchaeota archaeon]|nr:hypothetical protein [Candidatus Altiarchaeota archaeon]